jgi:uncharacterized membrane protein YgcG
MCFNERRVDVQMRCAAIQKDLGRYASDGTVELDETMLFNGLLVGDLVDLTSARRRRDGSNRTLGDGDSTSGSSDDGESSGGSGGSGG